MRIENMLYVARRRIPFPRAAIVSLRVTMGSTLYGLRGEAAEIENFHARMTAEGGCRPSSLEVRVRHCRWIRSEAPDRREECRRAKTLAPSQQLTYGAPNDVSLPFTGLELQDLQKRGKESYRIINRSITRTHNTKGQGKPRS